ncbi:nuclear transport factor 2 family protein [Nocardia noduli]|uniref:nuclear transport factor 2 family protein n=1 Tax=Nocardia noduli TaxID=2815722 RepID=UPI001C236E5B|nr:nuclear transport factor 2 family protein [Nocardia noduli]
MEIDSVAVHGLLARYGRLIDQRRAEEWSELFVADGCLEIPERDLVEGRAALTEFAANSPEGTHLTGIPDLSRGADRVLASSSWIFVARGQQEIRTGFYHDEILPPAESGGDMLFVRRSIVFLPVRSESDVPGDAAGLGV